MIDGYTYFGWDVLCEAVAAMRITRKTGVVIPIRKAANGDPSGDSTGNGVAKASIINELWTEEKGFEPLVELPPRRFSKPLP